MKFRKVVLWWIVTGTKHRLLTKRETRVDALIPLVDALFPGINYYSITGFSQVMRDCVVPALKKRFPELQSTPAEVITPEETLEITEFLPSKGYEWQDNSRWQSKFKKLLKAA